jgi:hypothetical protein
MAAAASLCRENRARPGGLSLRNRQWSSPRPLRRPDIDPAVRRVRGARRGDHLVHGQTVAEGRPDRRAGMDRSQEIARLDDDLILVAGAMLRPLAEGEVIAMRGAGVRM